MSARQWRGPCRYLPFAALLLLLAPQPHVRAQKRKQAGEQFRVTYTLKNSQDRSADEHYDGYLSVRSGGLQFRGRRYEHERVKARSAGPPFVEKFTCAEMTNLYFLPGVPALEVDVRGRRRFVFCRHGFAQLRAAITRQCGGG